MTQTVQRRPAASALDVHGRSRMDAVVHEHAAHTLECDGVELDLSAVLLRVDGRRTGITPQELRLLEVLMRVPDTAISRDELLQLAWPENTGHNSNTLTVIVNRLRRKLVRADGTSRIRTVRHVGYAFDSSAT